ncbi:CLUMA_CG005040, isoform A [Clunio marinus]|uniref:CLUMA_CG005040, isoform A n=1 Tax=Clunio marinus TaxID=568069 RepID=A0A1J1HTI2_9DIPT|nr:CLUMA_CG005040, isoform A [Clunio marinus]
MIFILTMKMFAHVLFSLKLFYLFLLSISSILLVIGTNARTCLELRVFLIMISIGFLNVVIWTPINYFMEHNPRILETGCVKTVIYCYTFICIYSLSEKFKNENRSCT